MTRYPVVIGLILLCSPLIIHASVRDELRAIERTAYPQRSVAVDALVQNHPTNPITPGAGARSADSTILFYRGPARTLLLAGDATAWEPLDLWRHVAGTDFWYARLNVPPEGRLDYKIVRDSVWLLDPRNPHSCVGGFGPNSELRGPRYVEPAWLKAEPVSGCRLDTLTVVSPQLGNTRSIVVVRPPGTDEKPTRFLLVHDGLEFLSLAGLDRYLAVAAARTDLDLPICVCVPPVDRTEEYATSKQEAFGRFITETVMPLIESRFANHGDQECAWGSLGASYGGRISLDLARRYPGKFDRLAPMSPSVGPDQQEGIDALEPHDLMIYLSWGTVDIPELMPECEDFAAMLERRRFAHVVDIRPQGHSWGFWRDCLDAAFTFLYAR